MCDPSTAFDMEEFLQSNGRGRRLVQLEPKETFFTQGIDPDCTFYLRRRRVKLTVVSKSGKKALIGVMSARDFLGDEAASSDPGVRLSTATAIDPCIAFRVDRLELIRLLQGERTFSGLFVSFLLCRSIRIQSDLFDQMFNSSEKRLARILLLMADFGDRASRRPFYLRSRRKAFRRWWVPPDQG